eukprot:12350001-Ditylum_brightwellii.AAC.1
MVKSLTAEVKATKSQASLAVTKTDKDLAKKCAPVAKLETKTTPCISSNSEVEGESQIEHVLLMEVKPITTTMMVWSQNWPSW